MMNITMVTIGKKKIELKAITEKRANQIVEQAKSYGLTLERNYRKIANLVLAEDREILNEIAQTEVKEIEINIEWKKSQMWGSCPTAHGIVRYADGGFSTFDGYRAGGCGYDKESTVIASVFNDYLKYLLHDIRLNDAKKIAKKPYGVRIGESNYFEGGVGTSCYYSISNFIGGELINVASGKNYDKYVFTMNTLPKEIKSFNALKVFCQENGFDKPKKTADKNVFVVDQRGRKVIVNKIVK